MKIQQYDYWLADLHPSKGTKPGKTRPIVIIQTDLLEDTHLSPIVCPITTHVQSELELPRVHLKPGQLDSLSDILVDQIRPIDNTRLISKLGKLTAEQKIRLKSNRRLALDS